MAAKNTNLALGTILTIGKGKDSFEMLVALDTPTHVYGPLVEGPGMATVPLSEVTKKQNGTPATIKAVNAALKRVEEGKKMTAADVPVIKREPKPERAPRAPREKTGESKFDQAVKLAKEHKNATRQEFIQILVTKLNMTPAGASTYASTARKAVK